jgi:hypothetical protein
MGILDFFRIKVNENCNIPTLQKTQFKLISVEVDGYYEKEEQIHIQDVSEHGNDILAQCLFFYHESVWIGDFNIYKSFGETYSVVSGGWYGESKGGRHRTVKLQYGKVVFKNITNYKKVDGEGGTGSVSFFKKKNEIVFGVKISTSDSIITFNFESVELFPKPKLYLFNRITNSKEDFSNRIKGLKLLESFNDN